MNNDMKSEKQRARAINSAILVWSKRRQLDVEKQKFDEIDTWKLRRNAARTTRIISYT